MSSISARKAATRAVTLSASARPKRSWTFPSRTQVGFCATILRNQTATSNRIPLRRRLLYIGFIYVVFLLLLSSVEGITRLTMTRVESLDMFVNTVQQKMQVAGQQSTIFEGDPLLLWRLKPNLDHAYWDFTVVSTNAQSFRADYPIGRKPAGTFRIVC